MKKCNNNKVTFLFFVLFNMVFLSFSAHSKTIDNNPVHPKVSSVLSRLQKESRLDATAVQAFSQKGKIALDNQNKIAVYMILGEGLTPADVSFEGYDVEVIKSGENVIKARVPIGMIETIADNVPGISFIKLPDRASTVAFTSEGVSLTGASLYHGSGNIGTGVKIGVIDRGFFDLSGALSNGDIPGSAILIDCTGSGCVSTSFPSESDRHGTGVTEVIYDMAPGAQLYLIKIDDTLDLRDAKDFCFANGIEIINHSAEYHNTNFYDGTCYNSNPVCSADDAFSKGILWVNAGGNAGFKHYGATFNDTDSDGWHNLSAGVNEISFSAGAGETIEAFLTWDAWPSTDQDYDLYLYDGTFTQIDQSVNLQSGSQPPVERILTTAPVTGTYYLRIRNVSTTRNSRLALFTADHFLNEFVSSGSLVNPADSTTVMAVGAMNHMNWLSGPQEGYSSQGPTRDGRTKPDIVGPDCVSNYSFSVACGTSISTPHVTGAAALILSANPTLDAVQLWNALAGTAIDMGSFGKDNIYGFGRLDLPQEPNIVVSPTDNDFGYVEPGNTSPPSSITISNTGTTFLSVSSMTLSDTANFSLDVNGGSNPCIINTPTIVAGGNCTVEVIFHPTSSGPFNETFTIDSDDTGDPTVDVTLTGNISAPDIAVSPSSHNFNSVPVGDSSTPLEVIIASAGSEPLNVSDISLSDPAHYSVDLNGGSNPIGSSSTTIPIGEDRTVAVTFSPSSGGTLNSGLMIESDDPIDPTVNVSLSGRGNTGGTGSDSSSGCTLTGRPGDDGEEIIGWFVITLVLLVFFTGFKKRIRNGA